MEMNMYQQNKNPAKGISQSTTVATVVPNSCMVTWWQSSLPRSTGCSRMWKLMPLSLGQRPVSNEVASSFVASGAKSTMTL
jgi:hypothetical protein